MTQFDIMDKFEAYETEATFTRGNKMTTQVVAMDDVRTVVADIAEELANGVNTEKEALHIDSVMPRFSVSLVYQNIKSIMLRTLILNAKDEANALVETIEYFKKETDGMGLVLKAVIELNEA